MREQLKKKIDWIKKKKIYIKKVPLGYVQVKFHRALRKSR
jgi:hypothetical protein